MPQTVPFTEEIFPETAAEYGPPGRQERKDHIFMTRFDIPLCDIQRRNIAVVTIEDKNVFDAVLNQALKHIFRNCNHRFKADVNRHRCAVIVCGSAERHTRYHNRAG